MLGIRLGHEREGIKFQLIPGPSTTLTIVDNRNAYQTVFRKR